MSRSHHRARFVLAAVLMAATLSSCDVIDGGAVDSTTPSEATPGVSDSTVSAPEDLLTPADVEAVSSLSGLKVVPYAPESGAGGDVNIATADGQLVAMLVVADTEVWHAWLTDGFTVSESADPPVGDESFIGPNPDVSSSPYIFGFLKGGTAVAIDTFFDTNGEVILSIEQLRELATIVEGRL